MKRQLILRDYQEPAADYIMNHNRTVLAVAPNGGKTEISIVVIERYLKSFPNNKVLVLTHSTNVLLDNYYDRVEELDVSFTYSKTFDSNANVHFSLPHSEDKMNDNYDFIIVDEAHENYFARRVQRIVTSTNPPKQLLLTGTPSKFIYAGGYDIFAVASNEISEKYFAKLNIDLVASSYDLMTHYNRDLEVNSNYVFDVDDTKKTLESVLNKLIKRLGSKFSPREFNHPSFITKIKNWAFTYENIGKTLIACRNTAQADDVYEIFKAKGVKVGISHYGNDGDSSEITKFKNNEYDVLVVVNRARLGYSDSDLMNIIDMTGTHNPDIIYQMFSRVLRGTPDDQKYYLKVTPRKLRNMDLTHISVCAALMLTDREYLLRFNGRNFNDLVIPVIRTPRRSDSGSSGGSGGSRRSNNVTLPEFTLDIIDTFKNILHNLDNEASIYKSTTIGKVKYELGFSKRRPPLTFEDILEGCRGDLSLVE